LHHLAALSHGFRYLPGVVLEQKWNKQQVSIVHLLLHVDKPPGMVNSLPQAIDSLVKKSGSKDSENVFGHIFNIHAFIHFFFVWPDVSPALLAAMKVTRYQSAKVRDSANKKPTNNMLIAKKVECGYGEWLESRKIK
jgi:hypothetical protein